MDVYFICNTICLVASILLLCYAVYKVIKKQNGAKYILMSAILFVASLIIGFYGFIANCGK